MAEQKCSWPQLPHASLGAGTHPGMCSSCVPAFSEEVQLQAHQEQPELPIQLLS